MEGSEPSFPFKFPNLEYFIHSTTNPCFDLNEPLKPPQPYHLRFSYIYGSCTAGTKRVSTSGTNETVAAKTTNHCHLSTLSNPSMPSICPHQVFLLLYLSLSVYHVMCHVTHQLPAAQAPSQNFQINLLPSPNLPLHRLQ